MALPCHVQLCDEGLVGEDDGDSAWYVTHMNLIVAGSLIQAKILDESYYGGRTLRLLRDDVGLDHEIAKTLLLRIYKRLANPCEVSEAFFDLEKFITELFYRPAAERLIRRIRSAPQFSAAQS